MPLYHFSHVFQVIDKRQTLLSWGEASLKAPLRYLRPWLYLLSLNSLTASGMHGETKAQITLMGKPTQKFSAMAAFRRIQVGISDFTPFSDTLGRSPEGDSDPDNSSFRQGEKSKHLTRVCVVNRAIASLCHPARVESTKQGVQQPPVGLSIRSHPTSRRSPSPQWEHCRWEQAASQGWTCRAVRCAYSGPLVCGAGPKQGRGQGQEWGVWNLWLPENKLHTTETVSWKSLSTCYTYPTS